MMNSRRMAEALWVSLKPMVEELVQQELARRAAEQKPKRRPRRLKAEMVEKGK